MATTPPNPHKEPFALSDFTARFAADAWRYLWATAVAAAAGLASVSVFTRLLDPEAYGQYAIVMATATLAVAALGGWIQQSTLRYLPRYRKEGRGDEFRGKLTGLVSVILLATVAVAAALYAALRGAIGDARDLWWPATLLIVGDVAFLSTITVFQAELRSKAYSIFKSLVAVIAFGTALLLVLFLRRDASALVIGQAAARLFLLLPVALSFRATTRPFDAAFLKTMINFGLPIVAWLLCGEVLAVFDRFVIGIFRGSHEVGIYSANYGIVSMGFALLWTPIIMAAHPIIMNAWESGQRARVADVISAFSRYAALVVLPALAYIAVFARDIVSVLLGTEFREGYLIAPLVFGGATLWAMSMFGHKGLELREKTGWMLAMVSVSAAINIVLNFFAVPRYGYMGAAVTTLISYATYPVLVWFTARRYLAWQIPWRALAKISLSAAVAGAACWGVRLWLDLHPIAVLAAGFVTCAVLYPVALRLTRAVTPGEFDLRGRGE